MIIVKRHESPPGGWHFTHPGTGMKFPEKPSLGYPLDTMLHEIRRHELANRLPVTAAEGVEALVAHQCGLSGDWVMTSRAS